VCLPQNPPVFFKGGEVETNWNGWGEEGGQSPVCIGGGGLGYLLTKGRQGSERKGTGAMLRSIAREIGKKRVIVILVMAKVGRGRITFLTELES